MSSKRENFSRRNPQRCRSLLAAAVDDSSALVVTPPYIDLHHPNHAFDHSPCLLAAGVSAWHASSFEWKGSRAHGMRLTYSSPSRSSSDATSTRLPSSAKIVILSPFSLCLYRHRTRVDTSYHDEPILSRWPGTWTLLVLSSPPSTLPPLRSTSCHADLSSLPVPPTFEDENARFPTTKARTMERG